MLASRISRPTRPASRVPQGSHLPSRISRRIPAQILYYNEAVPVLTQNVDLWGELLGYGNLPPALDWL
jgi:hypothetical protein